ncbi:MAG: type III secretion system export apparatus subunit SctR [Steroidobacteraceae bacterium]
MNASDPLLIVVLLIAVALLPFLALLVTSFTKIVVVLGLLRQALGLPQVPPNMVTNALAIILSLYVMAPIGMQAATALKEKLPGSVATLSFNDFAVIYQSISTPLRGFLQKHTTERDRAFFVRSAGKLWPPEQARTLEDDHMLVLVPSFTLRELTEAFQIGFVLYLAFVVIDLIVGNILLSLGMMMLSPTVVSTPFKLLLFVALDGWERLVQGLVLSYR